MGDHFDGLYRSTGNPYFLNKAKRLKECAETLVFNIVDGVLKLHQTCFCKVKLCAMCA